MSKIYEKGLNILQFAVLNMSTGTPVYGTPRRIYGAMELNADVDKTITKIPADNNSAYIQMESPTEGTGSIKFTGMTEEDIDFVTNAILNSNGTLAFGEDVSSLELGMKFTKIQVVDGITYSTDYMFHRVVCKYPSMGGKSIDENGNEIADCTMPIEIYACPYIENGSNKIRTFTKISQKKAPATYAALKDICFTPIEANAALATCVTTFSIVDDEAVAITGATIVLTDSSLNVITASDVYIYNLPLGTYSYTITKAGYITKTGTEIISSSDITAGTKTTSVALEDEPA